MHMSVSLSNAIYGALFALGIVGNISVMLAATRKSTHKVINVYLGHLVAADTLHLMSIPPLIHLSIVNTWTWGTAACKAYYMAHYINWTASIFIITAMAFDRYVAVVEPRNCQNRVRTRRFAWCLLTILWALSFLLMSPIGALADVIEWRVDRGEVSNGTEGQPRNVSYMYSCGHRGPSSPENRSSLVATAGNVTTLHENARLQAIDLLKKRAVQLLRSELLMAVYNFTVCCLLPSVFIGVFYFRILRKVGWLEKRVFW